MGKVTGFLEFERQNMGYRPVEERRTDYNEVLRMPEYGLVRTQGARCMDCGIPYCHALGCPLFNLIPEWNDAVYRGDMREAIERLDCTNNFPEITGRVCPAPCETSCTLSINSAPVTIKQIELTIIEYAFEQGWIVPRPPKTETGKRVAVIGSGPAGMAAAQQLRRMGHKVTLFERADRLGGILRYGIPDFKLEKRILDRRFEQMRAEGVMFETGVAVGDDISANYIQRKYDAIVLTMGAHEPRDLTVPGRGLEGTHFALPYLTMSNKCVAGDVTEDQIISARNKTVLVIGGGDTGSDCVGTANRQGAKKVYQFEILPKPTIWTESHNPSWPVWPNILRTSSSHEEGCERDWSILTKEFMGTGVKVSGVKCVRVEWKPRPDAAPQMVEVPGSGFSVKADLVLLAMGFVHVKHESLIDDLGVKYDARGNINTKKYQTSVPNVFAAGDADIGASLVVRAIYHGRETANAVDQYLMSVASV